MSCKTLENLDGHHMVEGRNSEDSILWPCQQGSSLFPYLHQELSSLLLSGRIQSLLTDFSVITASQDNILLG